MCIDFEFDSTGSLFTYLFALATGDETFALMSLVGMLFGVLGSILTGYSDIEGGGTTTMILII